MAERLWDLANLVTAFSVAQSLATLFAVVKGDFGRWLVDITAHRRAVGGTALFALFYGTVIAYCGAEGAYIEGSHGGIWLVSSIGRIAAVLIFSAILGVVFLGHWNMVRSAAVSSKAPGA